MNRYPRQDCAVQALAEIAADLHMLASRPCPIPPEDIRPLADALTTQSAVVEDCNYDVLYAIQILKLGRAVAPTPYLSRRLARPSGGRP